MSAQTVVAKMTQPAVKLISWVGVYALTKYLTGNDMMSAAAAQAGINNAEVGTLLTSIIPNLITDQFKEMQVASAYGVNHNLAGAFDKAVDAAMTKLAETFVPAEPLTDYQQKQLGGFFQLLGAQLKQLAFSAERVQQYAEDRPAFFADLWATLARASTAPDPDVPDAVLAQVPLLLTAQFEEQFRRYFNEEIKADDNAETAYFIELLECAARTNRDNANHLNLIGETLDTLIDQQTYQARLLRQLVHSQQLVQENLRKLAVDIRLRLDKTEAFQQRIGDAHEPGLTLPPDLPNPLPGHAFNYKTRYTTFISREAEMNALWSFVIGTADRPFTWWMVTGPGGMGKSRLALELCRLAQTGHKYVGFLDRRDIGRFRWSTWRPQHPTLLVIDYVATDTGAVQTLLTDLSRRQDTFRATPVRVLLLERELPADGWWATWQNSPELAACSHHPNEPERVLALPAFAPADLWRIVENVHQRCGQPLTADPTQTLTKLTEWDVAGRPLFAFFVGMALAEGNDISHWNVNKLLDNLLLREEDEIWKKHPHYADLGEGHKNLLLIATLTRGLWDADIQTLYANDTKGLPATVDNALYERMAHIAEVPTDDTKRKLFEGLQPDLVGEYFVLKRLQQLTAQLPHGRATAEALLQAAWTADARETWWMVYQAIRDYPKQPKPLLLASKPPLNAPAEDWLHWTKGAYNLLTDYGTAGDFVKAEEKYTALTALIIRFDADAQIALYQAMGAYNLLTVYGTAGDFVKAEEKYTALTALTGRFDADAQIALPQAEGAYNLLNDYRKAGDFVKAKEKYKHLTSLTNRFEQDTQIALCQAMGAGGLLLFSQSTPEQVNRAQLVQDLMPLLNQWHDHPDWQNHTQILRQILQEELDEA